MAHCWPPAGRQPQLFGAIFPGFGAEPDSASCGQAAVTLVHVAGHNLGLIMRLLVGSGTPRELAARVSAHLLALTAANTATAILIVATGSEAAVLVVSVETEPDD